MAQATWNGVVLAESKEFEIVEGNVYFPPGAIKKEYFEESDKYTTCPWKGVASYYDIVVDGERNDGAAWYYPKPSEDAANIKGYIAFWNGVEVTK